MVGPYSWTSRGAQCPHPPPSRSLPSSQGALPWKLPAEFRWRPHPHALSWLNLAQRQWTGISETFSAIKRDLLPHPSPRYSQVFKLRNYDWNSEKEKAPPILSRFQYSTPASYAPFFFKGSETFPPFKKTMSVQWHLSPMPKWTKQPLYSKSSSP